MLAINWYKITFFYKGIIRKVKNKYPPPPPSFGNIRRIYCVSLPKHRYCLIRAASVLLLKILNVSKLPRMAAVPSIIEFAVRTRRQRMNTDVRSLSCLRLIYVRVSALFSAHFKTDRDVHGYTQKRRFCLAKTRCQCVYGWTGWLSEASKLVFSRYTWMCIC